MSHARTLILVALTAACGNVQHAQPDAQNNADAPDTTSLMVTATGNGHVTSMPAGIDCGSACEHGYPASTHVILVATPDSGATFMGWGGACSGAGACEVVLTGQTTVTAAFSCTGMVTFDLTGAPQSWSPPCATTINVDVRGAGGGTAYFNSAIGTATLGGRVQASLVVHPTDVLNIYVGGAGQNAAANAAGAGGYNGGGNGATTTGQWGGGGGGASDIRFNGAALTDRVIVAGGAGGVASCSGNPIQGGGGGGLVGGDGASCSGSTETTAKGGNQSAGGAGGFYSTTYCTAAAGTAGVGAPGCSPTGGAGGGGGWFGGGGGSWNGGAGGSSFTAGTVTNVVHTQTFQPGNGQVIITY